MAALWRDFAITGGRARLFFSKDTAGTVLKTQRTRSYCGQGSGISSRYTHTSTNGNGSSSPPDPSLQQDIVLMNYVSLLETPHPLPKSLHHHPSSTTTYPDKSLIYTSIPPNDPHGTQCLIQGDHKSTILNYPNFPSAVPQASEDIYHIADAGDKGKGMFASRTIEVGELILAERPLLVTPGFISIWNPYLVSFYLTAAFSSSLSPYFPDFSPLPSDDSLFSFYACEVYRGSRETTLFEHVLEILLGRMSGAMREKLMLLDNSFEGDWYGEVNGVLRTNQLLMRYDLEKEVGEEGEGEGKKKKREVSLRAICEMISRINHSCTPNAHLTFHPPSFSYHLRAIRPIAKGDEITRTYAKLESTASQRTRVLKAYNIKPPSTSPSRDFQDDMFREELLEQVEHLYDDTETLRRISGDGWGENVSQSMTMRIRELASRVFRVAEDVRVDIETRGLEASECFYVVHLARMWSASVLYILDRKEYVKKSARDARLKEMKERELAMKKLRRIRKEAERVFMAFTGEEGREYRYIARDDMRLERLSEESRERGSS
ncbi:hypothetical protein BDQ17DRAFT_1547380 [Cyathus striatus]|nr:hypothetical protein BDQ17DRAFT_1547380 [Cyathus striatus]